MEEDQAIALVYARLVNYAGPYKVVINGSAAEQTFEACGEAVSRAVQALADAPAASVWAVGKSSAGWELAQASTPKTQEQAMAQMETEDELLPETTA